MTTEEHLSFELQEIFDQFTKLRDEYISLKAFCGAQEETLTMERERTKRLKENVEKLSKTCLLFERHHISTVEQLTKEKRELEQTVEDLTEQCDHLRLINIDRNDNDEQIRELQEEIETLKSQLLAQAERYNKETALLKQQHSDEIQSQKLLLQIVKQCASQKRKREQSDNADKSRKNASAFRWPELDIDFVSSAATIEGKEIENRNGNKRRKLYHEDKDIVINID